MQVFHEGLPGAGKSYEAMVYHILPAVKQGRNVITNIEGVSHEKLAALSGIPQRFVEQMVTCCDFVDIDDTEQRIIAQRDFILENTKKDSLVVIDEIQDMFPSGRQKLPSDHQKFFTEHRHNGLDIILMGQDLRDVHNIIRRRVHRKIVFTKLTALGANNSYKWVAHEATQAENFKPISSGTRRYEKKYFGLYNSHTTGTNNTDAYKDKRTNIWHSPAIKWGVPFIICVAYFSISFLIDFFTPPKAEAVESHPVVVSKPEPVRPQAAQPVRPSQASAVHQPKEEVKETEPKKLVLDTFSQDLERWRPRLSGVVHRDGKVFAVVEMLDSTLHAKDIYTSKAIEALGWQVTLSDAGLIVEKDAIKTLIRPWPLDPFGRASSSHLRSL